MKYFPDSHWQQISPAESGFDNNFSKAINAAQQLEIDAPVDLAKMLPKGRRHPNDRPLGPLKPRGKPSGVVIKDGYIVGQYGDVNSPQVTFSASKSYISALAGVAVGRGLIADLDQKVGQLVHDGGFDSEQNSAITWRQLLQQTSEWEGELFGIPDWIDRGRTVGGSATMSGNATVGGSASSSADYRALRKPGSFWEYNDLRVNRTDLALLRVFDEPLSAALAQNIMKPIGASNTWQWHGYETSWVEVQGKPVQSVSGGAHWGGGLWISTLDHARFGLLYLNRGNWNGEQLLTQQWIQQSLAPCNLAPGYGFLWWLNHENSISEFAGVDAFAARGAGGNIIFVWPAAEIVIVCRWCADTKTVIDSILKTLT